MVWSRQCFRKRSFHCRKKILMSPRKHVKLQFWLWRKRQETVNLGRSRIKQRVFKSIYCSRPRILSKTNQDIRITRELESPDGTTSQASNVCNGTAEKKVEMCNLNGHSNAPSLSSNQDFSDAPNDLKRESSECSVYAKNSECAIELKQNSGVDLTLVKEVKDTSVEIGSPHRTISKNIQEFLHDFRQKYGSFIPLVKNDLLEHLQKKSHKDFKDCEMLVLEITIEEMAKLVNTIPYFEVKYKKHALSLDDLSTLANDNWLNDQVINMYGELIMDLWTDSKVHFLNSFFHRQLVAKGYEGVKRWTKQVDLFSKRLLLVPVHVEVHWCLVTADFVKKNVCLYDSQGIGLHEVARNILKYLKEEAKEKKQTAFEEGWTVSLIEEIPQQTNENDCGVFVLEYSRCLALSEPLRFSQRDIPQIRKRIYKELCECMLHDKC